MTDREPERLRVVGATDLEKRLLAAAAGENPSPELRRRMARAVGVAAGGTMAAATTPAVATGTAAAGATWPLVSAGVLVLAVAGAAVGWSSMHRRPAAPTWPVRATVAATPAAPVVPALQPAPATAPAAAHRHVARAGNLRAEIALLDAARAAASAGDGARALALLRRYDASFPAGTFRPESAALQIEALARLGQTDRARALGRSFIAAHPDSPLVARVRRAMAGGG